MSFFPTNIARVPNMLSSTISLGSINRTQVALLQVQNQLSTMKEVNRPSDDPVRYAGIQTLQRRLAQSEQTQRNLSNASAALGQLDTALAQVSDLALDAKAIALAQVNSTSTPAERASQALVVDQLIAGLFKIGNMQGVSGYVFGASQPGSAPISEFSGGYRFAAAGAGLLADLGSADTVPITLGPSAAVGNTSARVRGSVDLNPNLTPQTRLSDLNGARGLGVSLGIVNFSFNSGPTASVDLAGAETINDVITRLTNAIAEYETANSVTVLGGGGISVQNAALRFDIPTGGVLTFSSPTNSVTGADLGLTQQPFTPTGPNAAGLDPKLTWQTPISALAGVTGPLGSIRVNNLGRSVVVDLSGATTLEGVKNAIESLNLGLRVVLNDNATGFDVLSEVSTVAGQAMSIEEVAGNNSTATRLGIRTLQPSTSLKDFNFGKGVQIVDNVINPATNTVDPALNHDFVISLGNTPTAAQVRVDLRPQDMTSVQTLLTRINAEIASQLPAQGLLATDLVAQLADGANGITFVQNAAFTQPIRVTQANNSPAAQQLGLLAGTYNAGTSTFTGTDTAKVRPDNLMTHLLDLRDALRTNDAIGIGLAGENIDRMIGAVSETRGMVGGFAQRVDFAKKVEDDRTAVDTEVQSQLQDVDFTAAATRFSLLQTQLQASLAAAGRLQARTLLDFLS